MKTHNTYLVWINLGLMSRQGYLDFFLIIIRLHFYRMYHRKSSHFSELGRVKVTILHLRSIASTDTKIWWRNRLTFQQFSTFHQPPTNHPHQMIKNTFHRSIENHLYCSDFGTNFYNLGVEWILHRVKHHVLCVRDLKNHPPYTQDTLPD